MVIVGHVCQKLNIFGKSGKVRGSKFNCLVMQYHLLGDF